MRNESCAERIEEHLEYERQVFTAYMTDWDVYENGNDKQPPFHEYGLSLDMHEDGYLCYLLSWGGPSDELRFYPDGKVEYWFMDWFDGACRRVEGEDWVQWLRDMFEHKFMPQESNLDPNAELVFSVFRLLQ